ncbi:O-antigen ligase family protein [Solibacillus sp. FSL R5-0449]|uniref:O-antigen ligase family protein n=1 Tax=Solibacillus sp. FSL R5-0449 TaxID=2921639 RepID=UPI0030CA7639
MKNLGNFFFIFSLFLGPYLAIKSLYFSHILIALFLGIMLLKVVKLKKINVLYYKKWYIVLPYFGVFWMIASMLWSDSISFSIAYFIYYLIGLSIIFILVHHFSYNEEISLIVKSITVTLIIVIPIAFLEMFTSFRLPLAPSQYTGSDTEPTVFWGNPNNFATVLNLVLPFVLFSKNKFKWLGAIILFIVIYYTNSRLNLIAFLGIVGLYFLIENKKKLLYFALSLCGIIVFMSILSDSFKALLQKVYVNFVDIYDAILEFLEMNNTANFDSMGTRQNLLIHGIEGLIDSNLIGVGAGASPMLHMGWLGETGAMHNFWIEILVEQGAVFFVLFMVWYMYLIIKNYYIFKQNSSDYRNRFAGAISISLTGFIIGALSPSSTIYMLPMWLFLGLAMISIFINEENKGEQ